MCLSIYKVWPLHSTTSCDVNINLVGDNHNHNNKKSWRRFVGVTTWTVPNENNFRIFNCVSFTFRIDLHFQGLDRYILTILSHSSSHQRLFLGLAHQAEWFFGFLSIYSTSTAMIKTSQFLWSSACPTAICNCLVEWMEQISFLHRFPPRIRVPRLLGNSALKMSNAAILYMVSFCPSVCLYVNIENGSTITDLTQLRVQLWLDTCTCAIQIHCYISHFETNNGLFACRSIKLKPIVIPYSSNTQSTF